MSSEGTTTTEAKGLPTIDVAEYGGKKDGVKQSTARRLFMQLLVFRTPPGGQPVSAGGPAEGGPTQRQRETGGPAEGGPTQRQRETGGPAEGGPTQRQRETGGPAEGGPTQRQRETGGPAEGGPTQRQRETGGPAEGGPTQRQRETGGSKSAADAVGAELVQTLRERKVPGVVYADTMDPRSLGLLTWSEDPARFVRDVRPLFAESLLSSVELRDDFGMIGRTYSTGHEPELEWSLLRRPIENVTNEAYRWHVWYPLRRKGAFAKLEPIDQSHILREHAALGMAYGAQELAHDVRLACHGIDAGDNEFVIGLVGRDLHPLSHLVQAMRKTRQTSEFIEKMGPFFVGYVIGSSKGE